MYKNFSKKLNIRKLFLILSMITIIISMLSTNSYSILYVPGTKVIRKIIAGSDNVIATSRKGGGDFVFKMEILKPYFIIEEEDEYYKIADKKQQNKHAFVKKSLVLDWNTREGLHFKPSITTNERTDVMIWDENTIEQFAMTKDIKKFSPSYIEDTKMSKSLPKKLLSFPVVDKKSIYAGVEARTEIHKKIYKVYIPAYVPETKIKINTTPGELEKILSKVTFCIVFDATGSMSKYGTKMAETIEELLKSLEINRKNINIGFVFFRDDMDEERIKIVLPTTMENGIAILRKESTPENMIGGGDAAEPILDAMVLSAKDFKWNGISDQSGGEKKIVIAVLNSDAKPETIGLVKSIAKKQTPEEVVSLLRNKDISVFSFQADTVDRGLLVKTLSQLSSLTGGEFYPWIEDSTSKEKKNFSNKIKELMTRTVYATKTEAEKIAHETISSNQVDSILPLKAINSEVITRLQGAAIKFSIENGGFIVREGWMFENEKMYQEKILVEKDFLEKLIRMFNYLVEVGGIEDEISGSDMAKAVTENLKAILGEDIPEDTELQEIVEKKMGIHFNTNLLAYSMESLFNLPREERLIIVKQIKTAEQKIENFLEAAASEFNINEQVWMELSYLP